MFLPSFGNNLSEDPHSVVIAHVLKVYIIHLVGGQRNIKLTHYIKLHYLVIQSFYDKKYYFEALQMCSCTFYCAHSTLQRS